MRRLDSRCPNRGIAARLKHVCICSYAIQEVISEVTEIFSWHLRWEVATGSRSGRCPVLAEVGGGGGGCLRVSPQSINVNVSIYYALCFTCVYYQFVIIKKTQSFHSPKGNLINIFLPIFRGWRWWRDGGAKSTGGLGGRKSRPEAGSERRYFKIWKDWILQVVILVCHLEQSVLTPEWSGKKELKYQQLQWEEMSFFSSIS